LTSAYSEQPQIEIAKEAKEGKGER